MFGWAGKCNRHVRAGLVALTAALTIGVAVTEASFAAGDVVQISSTTNTTLKVAKGKPKTIKTNAAFYEIVIGDPEIANVNPLTDKSFYVLGNNLGTTGIALFDENKQLVGTIDVEVTLDTDRLAATIRNSVPDANIEVSSANGRLLLSGSANDAVAAEKRPKSPPAFPATRKLSTPSTSPRRSRSSSTSASSRSTARRDSSLAPNTAPISLMVSTAAISSSIPVRFRQPAPAKSSGGCSPTAPRSTSPSRHWKSVDWQGVWPNPI